MKHDNTPGNKINHALRRSFNEADAKTARAAFAEAGIPPTMRHGRIARINPQLQAWREAQHVGR